MAHEFIRITERLSREHCVIPNHDRILQAASLDQPVLNQVFNFLEEAKGPGVRQILFPGLRGQFNTEELRETAFAIGAGAGDFQLRMRKNRYERVRSLELE